MIYVSASQDEAVQAPKNYAMTVLVMEVSRTKIFVFQRNGRFAW